MTLLEGAGQGLKRRLRMPHRAGVADEHGPVVARGGGSFDRALCRVHRSRSLALVYDDEVLDEVPAEPHDCRVGGILTPSGLVAVSD